MENLAAVWGSLSHLLGAGILPGLYDGVNTNNIQSLQDVLKVVGNVMRILIALSGGLAVLFIIISGIYYIISQGDPANIKKAKDTLVNAIVGLGIIIVAYAAVTFIAQRF